MQDTHFVEEIGDLVYTFSHSFSTDEDYSCTVEASNDLTISDFVRTFDIKVQHALRNLHLILWQSDGENYGILSPPSLSKDMYFVLQADQGQPLATDVSWEINYGTGDSEVLSTAVISTSDRDTQYDTAGRDHVFTWMANFDEWGDWTFIVRLRNEISNLELTFNYTVYEEVVGLSMSEILFVVRVRSVLSRI